MKFWLLFAATTASLFILSQSAYAAADSVTVGSNTLSLPSPEGFDQLALDEPLSEEIREVVITPSNRMLAHYVAAPDLEVDFTPIVHAQTPRGTEAIVYSIEQFKEITSTLTGLLGTLSDELPKNGESSSLGIHDQGAHHISFASLQRSLPEDPEAEGTLTYTAASMNNVAGSAVNLYCSVPAEPESNRAWAREQVAKWQQAVLTSNPQPLAEPKKQSPLPRGAIVGGVTGLLGALVGVAFLKSKSTQKAES